VPADAPPLFIALAADDPFFANGGYGLIDSWKAAKRPVEFHLYEQGGHGFGMYPKETTSTVGSKPLCAGSGCTEC
jgi:acetyl esterase/lipase